ncbi:BON domain-containing protein [Burkholderia stagnalis]
MQRRYPGRQVERRDVPDWREGNERTYRGAGERGMPDDEPWRPEEGQPSAYRLASENVGPEEWGQEWGERSARPVGEPRRRGTGWHDGPGDPRQVAREVGRGYGEPGPQAGEDREGGGYGGGARGLRGHSRIRRYAGGHGDEAPRAGGDAEREAMRDRRGPKGYTRSDERIREDVCERLAHALDIEVGDVSVQVREGRVELDGTVPARWMKHEIEDIADGCMCVRDVENRVRVRRDGERDTGMVLHPDQRTVTPTLPAARDPEPGESGAPGSPGREPRR